MFEFITDNLPEIPEIEFNTVTLLTAVFTVAGWLYFYFYVFKYLHPGLFVKLLCYAGMPVVAYIILQRAANKE